MVLFLVHSEPIGKYIHSTPPCISLDFRPKWAKSITVFKPKRRKNHTNFFLKDNNSF